jgi:hypothetical protein
MVMRTAAMPEQAKKTHKLMRSPILGHTSQMWEFFLQELKDIADVADLFPETRTAVELALAMRDDAVNMLGRDEVVDAKVSTNLLTVLYFLNTRPGTEISEDAYGNVLADVARIRAIIQGVHGASPGLRMVEKTDYYGWLVMFMLANAVNKAFSEMSDKSWLESNLLLDSALRICRNIYGHIFKDTVIFINGGELGGATTASWHAHLMETLNESYVRSLPARGDEHLITQEDFARLRLRPLDSALVQDFLADVATENFLHLGASLPKSDVPAAHGPLVARIRYLAQELANPIVESDFAGILPKLAQRDIRNPSGRSPALISVLDFLKSHDSDYLFPTPAAPPAEGKKKGASLTMATRKALFCRHVATYGRKMAYWDRHRKGITLSPATEILSGALLARLREQGLEDEIRAVVAESRTLPEDLEISVEIVSDIRSKGGAFTIPEIRFTAPAPMWSVYGKDVFAVAERRLNAWWGEVFDLAVEALRQMAEFPGDAEIRRAAFQKLDERFGLSRYFEMLKWRNIPFELAPGAFNYAAARHAQLEDIPRAVENYLEYFLAGFARSAKHSQKTGLHKRSLCPRTTTLRLRERDGRELRETIIRPMPAYKPLMPLAAFNTLLGPIELLAEANARFEVVELGGKRWVVQKMGGEEVLFQRDKRKQHYSQRYQRQQGERDFIGGINQIMKSGIMEPAHLGPTDELYRLYYVREHCGNKGLDFRAMARELGTAGPSEPAVQALAYADWEMERVRRRHQNKDHGFLHYKRIDPVLRPLRDAPDFNALLDRAGLSKNKILRDHITQIIAIREVERAHVIDRACAEPDPAMLRARAALLQDNLDTIVYFRLAESMVSHAFTVVVAARERNPASRAKDQRAILRDTRNSTFLLADTVARLLYRCVASHEQREEFQKAMHRGSLGDPQFSGMLDYVIKGLAYSGYKTREFWELEGAPETEGYIELLAERALPPEIRDEIITQRPRHAEAVETLANLLGRPVR